MNAKANSPTGDPGDTVWRGDARVREHLATRDLAGCGFSSKEIESQASLASRTAEQILGDEPPFDELIERLPHPALQEEVRAARGRLQSAFDDEMARVAVEAERLAVGDPQASDADRK
jgi:hypothetical protein